jgi:UDP-glucose 6-dehydrogenase
MEVVVADAGYVGLVTGAVLSYIGHSVTCVDVDQEKIARLNKGRAPIFEPRLEELIQIGFDNHRLTFVSDYAAARSADVIFITVGTPPLVTGNVDNKEFLNAGVGWGGSCFGKDLAALTAIASEYELSPAILNAAGQVNVAQRRVAIKKLQASLKIIKGRTIGLLGLAFKPNTDDVRAAPSLDIAEQLIALGAMVKAYDPVAMPSAPAARPDLDIIYCASAKEVAAGADALVIVTEWEEFRSLKLSQLKKTMRMPVIVDGRNTISPSVARGAGFEYYGIGR